MISIRRARPSDAISIGAVHVAAWRSTYPGILPDGFLARLSVPRQAAHYDAAIRQHWQNDYRPGMRDHFAGGAHATGLDDLVTPNAKYCALINYLAGENFRGGQLFGRHSFLNSVPAILDDKLAGGTPTLHRVRGRLLARTATAYTWCHQLNS